MNKLIASALLAVCILASACTVNVKTPDTPNFSSLNGADYSSMTRTEFEIAMGGPQSRGVHKGQGQTLDMLFYYGMKGRMTVLPSQSAQLDSGMGFASFDGEERLAELVYFQSTFDGPKIVIGGKLPVAEVADAIELGTSTIGDLEAILGEPSYRGTRYNAQRGTLHRLSFYDSSKNEGSGLLRERWLVAGYDDGGTIQDLLWVSSFPEDLKSLGEVEPQKLSTMTKLDLSFPFPMSTVESISSSTKIDPVQVEALIRSAPEGIEGYTKVLGKPTAVGFKCFMEHEPWLVSHWSYIHSEYLGDEMLPPMVVKDGSPKEVGYMVMEMKTTRLMIAHTPDGVVQEVIWLRPGNDKPQVNS